jgi:hypothetical protein
MPLFEECGVCLWRSAVCPRRKCSEAFSIAAEPTISRESDEVFSIKPALRMYHDCRSRTRFVTRWGRMGFKPSFQKVIRELLLWKNMYIIEPSVYNRSVCDGVRCLLFVYVQCASRVRCFSLMGRWQISFCSWVLYIGRLKSLTTIILRLAFLAARGS